MSTPAFLASSCVGLLSMLSMLASYGLPCLRPCCSTATACRAALGCCLRCWQQRTSAFLKEGAALLCVPHSPDSGMLCHALLHPAVLQLLGQYIEQYGSGEGFGVLFADSKEAW